ncbi:reverse transcriptase domain-containing protein [Tanacetum coccineum]
MPFGLRNAGATYQRLVDNAFHGQISRNLKVYVDDLVIKSCTKDEIVGDIEETFKTLRKINMKLNPKQCTFEVEEGMFLGYQVNTKGIKICPNKVDAVLSLQSPKCLKDVQKLNEEAEAAFRQIKEHIAKLPMLTTPEEQEELIIYLAASKEAVSVVLMTEREARQMSIYFVSRALRGPDVNYTSMEKLVLALVHASKRLKRYFQAHPIIVVTDQPIKNILSKPEVAGYMSDPHTGRSKTGYVFTSSDVAISWRSVKQTMSATSSNHVKILAIHEDGYIKGDRFKHILPKFFFTHELHKIGDIIVQKVRSSDNLADLFTNALPNTTFKKLVHDTEMRRLNELK